jgi:hypothetical protein
MTVLCYSEIERNFIMPDQDIKGTPEQRHETARKLEILRRHIKAGLDDLDRGDFIEVDGADLEKFLQTVV